MAWNSVANVIEPFFVCYIDLNAGRFNRWTAVIVRSWQIAEIDTNRIGVGATHHSHGCSARCVLYTHSNAIHAGQMCHYPLAFLAISRNVLTKSTKWFFFIEPYCQVHGKLQHAQMDNTQLFVVRVRMVRLVDHSCILCWAVNIDFVGPGDRYRQLHTRLMIVNTGIDLKREKKHEKCRNTNECVFCLFAMAAQTARPITMQ